MPKPCRADHGDYRPGCRVCELARTREDYAGLWGEEFPPGSGRVPPPPAGSPPAAPAEPCPHLGDPTGELVDCPTCAGSVRLRVFACAVHPEGCTVAARVGGRACCAGCPDRPAPEGLVAVPDPPPVALTPSRSRAVVTVAAGDEGRALLALSRPWMADYARRVDADFVALDWPGVKGWGPSAKFQLGRVLDYYERVCFFDADTLADPDQCPDLFAIVPPAAFGIYDDLPGLRRIGAADRLVSGYRAVRAGEGLAPLPAPPTYLNTGVMVFGRGHRGILAVPSRPIRPTHTAEQDLWTARLHDAAAPLFLLPAAGNYQWWEHGSFAAAPPPWAILHFSGLRPRRTADDRLAVMRGFARG